MEFDGRPYEIKKTTSEEFKEEWIVKKRNDSRISRRSMLRRQGRNQRREENEVEGVGLEDAAKRPTG